MLRTQGGFRYCWAKLWFCDIGGTPPLLAILASTVIPDPREFDYSIPPHERRSFVPRGHMTITYDVFDPSGERWFCSTNYQDAANELSEDEYMRVDGPEEWDHLYAWDGKNYCWMEVWFLQQGEAGPDFLILMSTRQPDLSESKAVPLSERRFRMDGFSHNSFDVFAADVFATNSRPPLYCAGTYERAADRLRSDNYSPVTGRMVWDGDNWTGWTNP